MRRTGMIVALLVLATARYSGAQVSAEGGPRVRAPFASIPADFASGTPMEGQSRQVVTKGEKGALIGGGLGVVVGVIAGAGLCTKEDSSCGGTAVGFGLLGGLIGAVLGALIADAGS